MSRLASLTTGLGRLPRLPTRALRGTVRKTLHESTRTLRRRTQPAVRLATRCAARAERWACERARGAAVTPVVRAPTPDLCHADAHVHETTELAAVEAPIAVTVRLAPPSLDQVERARRGLFRGPSDVAYALEDIHRFASLPGALVAPLEQVVHSARDGRTRARAAMLLSRAESDAARAAVARLRAHVARRDEFLGRTSELHALLANNPRPTVRSPNPPALDPRA